jgi:predicted metal-binding protein
MGEITRRVIVCETCAAPDKDPIGADFARSLQSLVPECVRVETAACMNLCERPMALALRAEGCEAFLFSGVTAGDIEDAAALARVYAEAPGGKIHDASPAGRLRHCLVGRIPG